MTKEFNTLVFIGRFSPFHKGHEAVINKALTLADEVIVVVGSSFAARNTRNPFLFEERKKMIRSVFPDKNVLITAISDFPYDDTKWISAVRATVMSTISNPNGSIGLIGHSKDHTSYYLKIFPDWGNVEVDNVDNINATDIRKALFWEYLPYTLQHKLSAPVIEFLVNIQDKISAVAEEYKQVQAYKDSWKSAPYPPIFVTTDAVVVQSGHVLLVKRAHYPGKGLWALPGGFLNQNERIVDGTVRELKEETRIKVPEPVLRGSIKETKVFDHPNRSTRGRTITHASLIDLGFATDLPRVRGSDDAELAKWIPLNLVQQDQMFEDHMHILDYFTNIL